MKAAQARKPRSQLPWSPGFCLHRIPSLVCMSSAVASVPSTYRVLWKLAVQVTARLPMPFPGFSTFSFCLPFGHPSTSEVPRAFRFSYESSVEKLASVRPLTTWRRWHHHWAYAISCRITREGQAGATTEGCPFFSVPIALLWHPTARDDNTAKLLSLASQVLAG